MNGKVDNIVFSNFVETKNNSDYLIRYLNEVIRPLFLLLPKMSNIKTIKVKNEKMKDESEIKYKNNK